MSQSATVKMEVAIDKGPSEKPGDFKIEIDAYQPIVVSIPPKPADNKNYTEVIIDAGDRDRLKFLLLSAGQYADPACPKFPIGLLLQFPEDDPKVAPSEWADAFDVIPLDGPLFFSGYTLSMLPAQVNRVLVQNYLGKSVDMRILVGKSAMKPSSKPIPLDVVKPK
jgi:hypothetical protein